MTGIVEKVKARMFAANKAVSQTMGDVEAIRAQIASLQQERRAIEVLPGTFAEAHARLKAHLDAAAQIFNDAYLNHFIVALISPDAKVPGLTPAPVVIGPDTLTPTFAALFRPAFETALTEMLRQHCEQNPGIGADERQQRQSKLDKDILGLETTEEALIEMGGQSGLVIARRPDASPAVILGLGGDL